MARARAESWCTRGSRSQTLSGSRSSLASSSRVHSWRAHSSRPDACSLVRSASASASRCSTSPRAYVSCSAVSGRRSQRVNPADFDSRTPITSASRLP